MPEPDWSFSISPDRNLARYLQNIRRFPMLGADEEYALAKRWADHGDEQAAHTGHQPPAIGREDRHGLPRLWIASRGAHFRGQRRHDAGGHAF